MNFLMTNPLLRDAIIVQMGKKKNKKKGGEAKQASSPDQENIGGSPPKVSSESPAQADPFGAFDAPSPKAKSANDPPQQAQSPEVRASADFIL